MRKEILIDCPHCKKLFDVDEVLDDDHESASTICECGAKLLAGFYKVGYAYLILAPEGEKE